MAGVSLSGFLPGDNRDGLSRLADMLVASFEEAYGRATVDAVEVVVVGVLQVESVKHRRNPEEKPPTAEVRFAAIEAVEGPEADQVRAMVARLRDTRSAVEPLPGMDAELGELPDPNNVAEPDRPKRRRGRGRHLRDASEGEGDET